MAACLHLEVIYILLHLHDLVMILSTDKRNRFIQIPEFYNSFRTLTSISHQSVITVRLTVIEVSILYLGDFGATWGAGKTILCYRPRPPSNHNNIPDTALGVAIDHT